MLEAEATIVCYLQCSSWDKLHVANDNLYEHELVLREPTYGHPVGCPTVMWVRMYSRSKQETISTSDLAGWMDGEAKV